MARKRDQKCRRCVYRSDKPGTNECDYCFLTGKLRGCPNDDRCDKFKEGKRLPSPLTLPGPAPSVMPQADKDAARYDREKRQRIYGYKEALRSYAESEE